MGECTAIGGSRYRRGFPKPTQCCQKQRSLPRLSIALTKVACAPPSPSPPPARTRAWVANLGLQIYCDAIAHIWATNDSALCARVFCDGAVMAHHVGIHVRMARTAASTSFLVENSFM